MIGIDRLWDKKDELIKNKTKIAQQVEELTNDPVAKEVIIGKPNTAQAIRERLRILRAALEG
jgi:ribonucleotide monophosphatase NagD (HAD superfamily)